MLLDRISKYAPKPEKSAGGLQQVFLDSIRIARSPLFDEAYYLSQFPTGSVDEYPPLHYAKHWKIAKSPHPQFDVHLEEHSGKPVNPLLHYIDNQPMRPSGLSQLEENIRFSRESLPYILFAPARRQFNFERGCFLYALAVAMHQNGCEVGILEGSDIEKHRRDYRWYEHLLQEPWCPLVEPGTVPEDAITISDCPDSAHTTKSVIWRRSPQNTTGNSMFFPFPTHPRIYQNGMQNHLLWFRQRQRYTRVLFAGQNDWQYRLPHVRFRHTKMPRPAVLKQIRRQFDSQIDRSRLHLLDLSERNESSPPIVLADRREDRTPSVYWLDRLSMADFFLAAPGAYFPMCHNAIEAMAMGTIPILEYPEHFHPKLEDNVNCVSYSGSKGLSRAIQRVLSMPADAIQALRENAASYYDNHLSMRGFASRLIDQTRKKPITDLYFPLRIQSRSKTVRRG